MTHVEEKAEIRYILEFLVLMSLWEKGVQVQNKDKVKT